MSNGLGEPQDPVAGALERNQRTVIRDTCHHFTQLPFSSMLAAYVSQLGMEIQAVVASIEPPGASIEAPGGICIAAAGPVPQPRRQISFPLLPPLTSFVSFTHEITQTKSSEGYELV